MLGGDFRNAFGGLLGFGERFAGRPIIWVWRATYATPRRRRTAPLPHRGESRRRPALCRTGVGTVAVDPLGNVYVSWSTPCGSGIGSALIFVFDPTKKGLQKPVALLGGKASRLTRQPYALAIGP
jgi:hypothetical protein